MSLALTKRIIYFILGLLFGGILMYAWQWKTQKVVEEMNDFSYGVVSSNLQAENIVWQEYPQFRTVQFTLEGELVITIPRDAQLTPDGLVKDSFLVEKSRTKKCLSDGKTSIAYDEVVYVFEKVSINVNTSKKVGNPEKDALCGYELSYADGEQNIVYAFILPMCEEFIICSLEETRYWNYSQSVDIGFLSLSKTYLNNDITSKMKICPTVRMEKVADSYEFVIANEGDTRWNYSDMVPSVEVWNQGVWMELSTYLDNPATLRILQPGEVHNSMLSAFVRSTFPYFSPGLYRLVVYGGDGTYIATECFVVE